MELYKAFITDKWLKRDTPPNVRRALANAKDPLAAKVPAKYRTALYGKGGRWKVRLSEKGADGRIREHSETYAKRADAEKRAAELTNAVANGTYQSEEQRERTFDEAARIWRLTWRNISSTTATDYSENLERYILPRWGNVPLLRINEPDVLQWLADLKDGTAPCVFKDGRKPKPHSNAYVRYIYITFGAVIGYAVTQGWLTRDPLRNISVPRTDPDTLPERKIYLRPEEVDALATAAETLPRLNKRCRGQDAMSGTLVYFLAYTGLRIGEAIALRVGDVDLERRRIIVNKTMRRDGTPGPPKNRKPRIVAMPQFVADMLKRLTEGMDKTEPVFQTANHTPLNEANWRNRVFRKAVMSAGLDTEELAGLRPHSLRHTYASLAVASGCDVVALANSMGHSDPSITLNYYADLWPDHLDEVSSALEKMRDNASPIGA